MFCVLNHWIFIKQYTRLNFHGCKMLFACCVFENWLILFLHCLLWKQLVLERFCVSYSSRMIEIQMQMAERATELLALPDDEPRYLLDIG